MLHRETAGRQRVVRGGTHGDSGAGAVAGAVQALGVPGCCRMAAAEASSTVSRGTSPCLPGLGWSSPGAAAEDECCIDEDVEKPSVSRAFETWQADAADSKTEDNKAMAGALTGILRHLRLASRCC